FAQMVGYGSAQAFFEERGDSARAQQAADRWHDEIVLGDYYAALVARLETLYSQHPDSTALEEGRRSAAVWARSQLEGPIAQRFRSSRIGRLTERAIKNAHLI